MLETGGLTKEDVNMVDPGFGVVQLVVEGKVDTGHGLVYGEPAAVNAKRKEQGKPPVDFWLYSDYGVPNFYFMMFVANENWIERNSATTCRFLRATKKGYAEFEQNRDVYNKIFAKRNEVFTLADHSSFTDVTLPDWKGPNGKFYEQEASVWKAAMDWALKAKLITVGDEPATTLPTSTCLIERTAWAGSRWGPRLGSNDGAWDRVDGAAASDLRRLARDRAGRHFRARPRQ